MPESLEGIASAAQKRAIYRQVLWRYVPRLLFFFGFVSIPVFATGYFSGTFWSFVVSVYLTLFWPVFWYLSIHRNYTQELLRQSNARR